MIDLKALFETVDAEPAPDLRGAIATRARHYSEVPGALGEDPGTRQRAPIQPAHLLVAAALIAIAVGVAIVEQWRAEAPVKPRPSPPPVTRPSPPPATSLSDVCPSDGCVLDPGNYSVDWGVAKLTFGLPKQWHVYYSTNGWDDLQVVHDAAIATVIWVGLDPKGGSYDFCPGPSGSQISPVVNPARTPDEIERWLIHHPKLKTTNIHHVEVGGLQGSVLDVFDVPGAECPLLAIPGMNYPWDLWRVLGNEKGRLYVLWEPRSKTTIVIGIKATRPEFDSVLREVEPIVQSFVFS